jgi:hypothetical protein
VESAHAARSARRWAGTMATLVPDKEAICERRSVAGLRRGAQLGVGHRPIDGCWPNERVEWRVGEVRHSPTRPQRFTQTAWYRRARGVR